MKIEIKHKTTGSVLFGGAYDSRKLCIEAAVKTKANLCKADLYGADLYGANLCGANLGWANLGGANLGGANLGGANLGGAKNYYHSHDIFARLVINATIKFTVHEQEMVFRVVALRLCWHSIHKEYGKKMTPVFKKLAKMGWGEFLEEWEKTK